MLCGPSVLPCPNFIQVLSESVSKALVLTGGSPVEETAKFVDLMDKFFDCLNVHNYSHGFRARKPFQLPYRSGQDKKAAGMH